QVCGDLVGIRHVVLIARIGRRSALTVVDAVERDEPTASPKRRVPVAERARRIDERPQNIAVGDHVDTCGLQWRLYRGAGGEHGWIRDPRAEFAGASELSLGEIETAYAVAEGRQDEREEALAGAEVDRVGRRGREPLAEQRHPDLELALVADSER